MLIVANPVDILTYTAWKLSGYPENRVFGSGTTLDTARLKYLLGQHLDVDSRSVHAFIVGEHGDSEIAVWSSANVSGIPINRFCEMRGHFHHEEAMQRIAEDVKNSAYEIINKKGATYYGIAMSVKNNKDIDKIAYLEDLGVAKFDSENAEKPYIRIAGKKS